MLFAACANGENNSPGNIILADEEGSSVEKIEAYHFHSNRQCNVCKTIGNNLDETINRYFSKEVADGKIVYGHINIQSPENEEITNRYGAQGTSLWIGVYDKKGFHAENDQKIWFKLRDKEEFITYLKDLIEKRLSGEMN
jgi:frataxin-like iron-binding protein CyaY